VPKIFSLAATTEGPKDDIGGGDSGEGAATPPYLQIWGLERCELPQQEPDRHRFQLFSALMMASPDTIILLTVDYHAAIGGRTPVARPLSTPLW